MIEILKCQLEFLVYNLSTNYQDLWEMLKKCTDLKNCSVNLYFYMGIPVIKQKKNKMKFILMLTIFIYSFH